jgi:hypothetical protein
MLLELSTPCRGSHHSLGPQRGGNLASLGVFATRLSVQISSLGYGLYFRLFNTLIPVLTLFFWFLLRGFCLE